jgi:chromosome segregation ATPase
MNLATKALEFWDYQKQTELEYHKMSLKNQQIRLQNVEKQCNERLVEAQNKVNVLTLQLSSLKEELQSSKKEASDLQEKYTERTRYMLAWKCVHSRAKTFMQTEAKAGRTL